MQFLLTNTYLLIVFFDFDLFIISQRDEPSPFGNQAASCRCDEETLQQQKSGVGIPELVERDGARRIDSFQPELVASTWLPLMVASKVEEKRKTTLTCTTRLVVW